MYALSAADAVVPAIERTRSFLFRPFRWSTFLKLCLVAFLTEGLGNFRSSRTQGSSPSHGPTLSTPFEFTPLHILAIVAMLVLVILLASFVYYLITRLRFAYFHCLVYNTREIRSGWHRYRPQAVRFFWLNLAVGFCFLLMVAVIALPFAAGLWRLFRATEAGGHLDPASILAFVVPLIPIVILLLLVGISLDLVLRDWMLPHFALENATAGQAWAAVWQHISAAKRQFFVYALLRLILPILAAIAVALVLMIPTLIFAAAVAFVAIGIHSSFASATGAAATVAGVFLQVFFGVVSFGFAVLVCICIAGPLSTGIREYALLFYGSRYQRLGDILSPHGEGSPSVPGIA